MFSAQNNEIKTKTNSEGSAVKIHCSESVKHFKAESIYLHACDLTQINHTELVSVQTHTHTRRSGCEVSCSEILVLPDA